MRRARLASLPLTLVLGLLGPIGCGEGASSGGEETGGAEDGTTDVDTGSQDSSEGDETDGGDGDGDGDGDGEGDGLPARGIAIERVDVLQGSQTSLSVEGVAVDAPSRSTRLVTGRDTLFRAVYRLEPGFTPRNIRGVLTVDSGGQVETGNDTLMIDAAPNLKFYDGTFRWVVPGSMIGPDTTWQVELQETGPTDDPEGAVEPVSPSDGPGGLQADPADMKMRVIVVPILHTAPDPDRQPIIDDTALGYLSDELYEQNPLADLELEVHEPYAWSQPISNPNQFSALLGAMSNLKNQEGIDPDVYVHALVNLGCPVVGCSGAGVAGVAWLTDPTQGDGNRRVGVNVWYNPNTSARTVNHEVGHNQGLPHVACPGGGAQGTDPNYPHAEGRIGAYGFGVRNFTMAVPDREYDYMSYCGPTWVSDWTWEKTFDRVETLTSWGFADQGGGGEGSQRLAFGQVTHVLVDDDGQGLAWSVTGEVPSQSAQVMGIEVETAEGESLRLTGSRWELPEGGGWGVTLPGDLDIETIMVGQTRVAVSDLPLE